MNNIDWSFLFTSTGIIITFITLLVDKNIFFGKKNEEHKIKKFIPIIVVIFLITNVFGINYYYTKKLQNEKSIYDKLFLKFNVDNENITNKNKDVAIDSLKMYKTILSQLIQNIEKQEKITGKNSEVLDVAVSKLSKTNSLIKKIKTYNEILDKEILIKNKKGYMTTGNTSNFEFYCPTDKLSDYIDLSLYFNDEKLIDKIAYIMIEVSQKKSETSYDYTFEEIYKPQKGINTFRIRNYLKKPNMVLSIGYILKSEQNKEYPEFEKVNCYSYE